MTIDEYNKSKRNKKSRNYFKSFVNRFMICTIILFSILIICNKEEKARIFIKDKLFSEEFNFSNFNKFYNKYVADPISKLTDDMMVFKETENKKEVIEYNGGVKIKDENSDVKVIESGIVVFIGEKDDLGKTVIIQQSNGIDCTYGNLDNINVNLYSYQTKSSVIGTYNDYLYLYFEKDGKRVDYKDILE